MATRINYKHVKETAEIINDKLKAVGVTGKHIATGSQAEGTWWAWQDDETTGVDEQHWGTNREIAHQLSTIYSVLDVVEKARK